MSRDIFIAGYNNNLYNSHCVATVAADLDHCDRCDSCMVTTLDLTTGVISVITTAPLVAGISMAFHITVYQCIYKAMPI